MKLYLLQELLNGEQLLKEQIQEQILEMMEDY
jgi:hypothetical protein